MTPSTPYSTASLTSSAVCTPFSTIGTLHASRIQVKSSHVSALSMYCAINLPSPLPFLSVLLSPPLIADLIVIACAAFSSASRLPGTGASTVTKTALMPRPAAILSRSIVFCRSELQ